MSTVAPYDFRAEYAALFGNPEVGIETAAGDEARLADLCDRIDVLLDAGDRHEARRLTLKARNLSRRVYGAATVTLKSNGGRSRP